MRKIKTYEGFGSKNSDKNYFLKSDYTFTRKEYSKIDPNVKVTVKTWMVCPVCNSEIEDIAHGEIRKL